MVECSKTNCSIRDVAVVFVDLGFDHHRNKLINIGVPHTIDDRPINTKCEPNLWERNENHTLCLNSAKAMGCIVANVASHDLDEDHQKK